MAEVSIDLHAGSVRAVQLALFDEDFDLEPDLRAFAHAYLANGRDGAAAVLSVRPHLTPDSAVTTANRWLGTRRPGKDGRRKSDGNPELLRYLAWMQARGALRAELTLDELIEKSRRVFEHAVGTVPVPKTIFPREGNPKDTWVREPNLAAANTAVETLRKLGGFGKDLGPAGQAASGKELTATERAARVAAILERRRRDMEDENRAA